jgi:hypothetical protein
MIPQEEMPARIDVHGGPGRAKFSPGLKVWDWRQEVLSTTEHEEWAVQLRNLAGLVRLIGRKVRTQCRQD